MTQGLQRLVNAAPANLSPQTYASVSLMDQGRQVQTAAASDERALRADQLQYQVGQGPCLDAIREQDTVSIEDLTADARQPGWLRRAAQETGIRSALSLPLRIDGSAGSPGSLDLYSPRRHPFTAGFIAGVTIVFGIVTLAIVIAYLRSTAGGRWRTSPVRSRSSIGMVFLIVGPSELFSEIFLDSGGCGHRGRCGTRPAAPDPGCGARFRC